MGAYISEFLAQFVHFYNFISDLIGLLNTLYPALSREYFWHGSVAFPLLPATLFLLSTPPTGDARDRYFE
jgi:hypothetical protein